MRYKFVEVLIIIYLASKTNIKRLRRSFMDNNESLSALEAAQLLKITKNTVYELVKRGEIPSYKVGKKLRIDKHDVEEYINRQKSKSYAGRNNEEENKKSLLKEEVKEAGRIEKNENDIIISGQDMILDLIAEKMRENESTYRILRSNVGSYTSLFDLYNDNISMCSCHLWDGDNDEYNFPYVRRLLPGTQFMLINLAYRKVGFYVEKGNPHNIKTWTDLLNKDISIVNREKGSGVRILIDEMMRKHNIKSQEIRGYNNIKQSHFSVAGSITRKEADVGIGSEKVGNEVRGIDFIAVQEEKYDLVIKYSDAEKPFFKKLIFLIQSKEFKEEIESLGYYDVRDIGRIIVS